MKKCKIDDRYLWSNDTSILEEAEYCGKFCVSKTEYYVFINSDGIYLKKIINKKEYISKRTDENRIINTNNYLNEKAWEIVKQYVMRREYGN